MSSSLTIATCLPIFVGIGTFWTLPDPRAFVQLAALTERVSFTFNGDRQEAAFPVSGVQILDAESNARTISTDCLDGILSPAKGAQLTFVANSVSEQQTIVSVIVKGGSKWIGQDGRETLLPDRIVVREPEEAESSCKRRWPRSFTLWGPAEVGERPGAYNIVTGETPATLQSGRVAIYGRSVAADSSFPLKAAALLTHVELNPAMYAVATIDLPPGARISEVSPVNSQGHQARQPWYGTIRFDQSRGALQVDALMDVNRLQLSFAGVPDSRLEVDSFKQAVEDPHLRVIFVRLALLGSIFWLILRIFKDVWETSASEGANGGPKALSLTDDHRSQSTTKESDKHAA